MRTRIALPGTLLLLFGYYVTGQEITATISGRVTDPSGAVVPGATITVVSTDKAVTVRSLRTSGGGQYVVPLLSVGHYDVIAEASGFNRSSQTGIELSVNDRRTINFVLQVRGVEADPLQVNLQSPTAEGLISGTQIRELAINTRNYSQLVALQPGVSSGLDSDEPYVGVSSLTGRTNLLFFSVNGARASQNNWTLDGADKVDRGSNLTILTFPS